MGIRSDYVSHPSKYCTCMKIRLLRRSTLDTKTKHVEMWNQLSQSNKSTCQQKVASPETKKPVRLRHTGALISGASGGILTPSIRSRKGSSDQWAPVGVVLFVEQDT